MSNAFLLELRRSLLELNTVITSKRLQVLIRDIRDKAWNSIGKGAAHATLFLFIKRLAVVLDAEEVFTPALAAVWFC